MNKISFNMNEFCISNRITLPELAEKTKHSYVGVWEMAKRGTIKLSYLRTLETHFGDCSRYIIKSEIKHGKRVA